jgi:ribonuclease E
MIENEDRSSHWQALAEQLGLDPEKPAGPRPPSPEKATAPIARVEPSVEPSRSMEAPMWEPLDEEVADAPRDRMRDSEIAQEVIETSTKVEQPTQREPGTTDQNEDESEGERGGKRRSGRRRRRRSRSGDSPPGDDKSAAPGDESVGEQPDTIVQEKEPDDASRERSRRRGRGRRRSGDKDAPRREETPTTDAQTEQPAADAGEDADLDDLSNWQAPSWQELIGSLYRPER